MRSREAGSVVTSRAAGRGASASGRVPLAIAEQAGAAVVDLPCEQSGYLAIEAGDAAMRPAAGGSCR